MIRSEAVSWEVDCRDQVEVEACILRSMIRCLVEWAVDREVIPGRRLARGMILLDQVHRQAVVLEGHRILLGALGIMISSRPWKKKKISLGPHVHCMIDEL